MSRPVHGPRGAGGGEGRGGGPSRAAATAAARSRSKPAVYRPVRASECTQPFIRDLALASWSSVKNSFGSTLSTA